MDPSQLFGSLAQLLNVRQFCDVILHGQARGAVPSVVSSSGVRAHRVVLAASSTYFFNLFQKSPNNNDSVYVVKGVEPATLRAIVDYMYRPESLVVTVDNARALLAAADLLAVDGVRDDVCAFLKRALTVRDQFESRACSVLADDAARFVRDHFAPRLELLEPSADTQTDLLDELTASVKQNVLDAVLGWTWHLKKGRSPALRAVVEYVFRPESLSLSAANAHEMSSAGELLAMDDVRGEVCDSLERALTIHNALGIRAFAERHACATLAAAATRFVYDHSEEVLRADELLELSADALAALVDDLAVSVEEHVLDAVLRWTERRPQERRRHLAELLQRVRLPAVPQAVLAERARAEPLASADPPVKDLIIRAFTFHGQSADRRALDAAASTWYRPRQSYDPFALFVIGGNTNDEISSDVLYYEQRSGRWRSAPALPAPHYGAGAAELDGRLYVVGGYDGRSRHNTVFVYDVATNAWLAGPTLRAARDELGVAVLGGVLYAAGGRDDGGAVLRSAEALDPREGVWRSIADMSSGRADVAVAALGGLLYAAGGTDDDQYLYTVERYDPAADRWGPTENMARRRYGARAAVLGDELYVVGGYDGWTALRSVERYRAGAGWQPAPRMPTARSWPAVAAHAGRLYAAGGVHTGGEHLSSMAVFEPATGAWSELAAALPAGRWAAAGVVLDWSSVALPTT